VNDWEIARQAELRAAFRASSDVPRKYRDAQLDSFVVSSEKQAAVLRSATEYVRRFQHHVAAGVCITFCGPPGTGKTMLACAVLNAVIEAGNRARYTTLAGAQRALRATWNRSADMTEAQVLESFVVPALLAIDEAGTGGTDAERSTLFELIDARYSAGKPTLVVTNSTPKLLHEALGVRVVDRLREAGGQVVGFAWESVRSKVDRSAVPEEPPISQWHQRSEA